MWLWTLRNYDGDGNGNENVNRKEKAFIEENNNSGLFQAFRQWRVVRNGELREKKEALSLYSHSISPYPYPLSAFLPHFSLRRIHYLNAWNRLILAHFDSVTASFRSEISRVTSSFMADVDTI